jgi:hypothetical protein
MVATGVRWMVDPSAAAAQLGMPLLDGVARSSQVGDMTAFFLTTGILMLTALVTGRRGYFFAPALLLGLTAVARTVAWMVHDAALAMHLIAPEVIIAVLLLLASYRLAEKA